METEQKTSKRLTPQQFQWIALVWLIVITLVLGYLVFSLLRIQSTARTMLDQAADDLIALANAHIEYTVSISRVVAIDAEIPFNQTLVVPVDMEIDHVFPIDTSIYFQEEFTVPISQVLSIDQTFNVPFDIPLTERSVTVPIPIQANIPIQFEVAVPIDKELEIQADIPVQLPITEDFTITISRTIPIQTSVPIVLDIPIDIALSDTPFGEYLQNLGESLR
ncbi:MAG: hypothetical protein GY832_32605 [Chloroflexi bacterium]|nr:hypothetical protein [Chloroflexota bacterium]